MSGVLVLSLLLRPYSMGAEKPDATRFFALRATLDDGAGNGWRREFHHKLPPFSVRDLKGRVWTLSDLHGRAVFLGAWATWCGPCR